MIALLFVICIVSLTSGLSRDYCIIGAGPGGLQIGYYLQQQNRDYIIFDRANVSGSFFREMPRHRQLISINKRYTGQPNPRFNMKFDMNSLLSDDQEMRFTKYSDSYFGHADDLVRYFNDYQKRFNLKVQFNTEVKQIRPTNHSSCRFAMSDNWAKRHCCSKLIVATGLPLPNEGVVKGVEFMEDYGTVSTNQNDFAGQSVMILGMGNSAFETAKHIYGHTNYVHMLARSKLKFSWDTHYVGDLRAVNNEVADSDQLKTLDGLQFGDLSTTYVNRRPDGRLELRSGSVAEFQKADYNGGRNGYDRVIRCFGYKFDSAPFANDSKPTGWRERTSGRHDEGAMKYPSMDMNFQSTDFDHLYYAGALTHALDHRRSAGTFIHGFRYSALSLHRLLEYKYHGVRWPSTERPLHQLVNVILKSVHDSPGLHQMVKFLCAVAVIHRQTLTFDYLEDFPLELLPRFPQMTGHKFDPKKQFLAVVTLQFGKNFSTHEHYKFGGESKLGGPLSAEHNKHLHPIIYLYRDIPSQGAMNARVFEELLPKPAGIVNTMGDLLVVFEGAQTQVMPMRKFFEFFLQVDLRVWLTRACAELFLTTTVDEAQPTYCHRMAEKQQTVLSY